MNNKTPKILKAATARKVWLRMFWLLQNVTIWRNRGEGFFFSCVGCLLVYILGTGWKLIQRIGENVLNIFTPDAFLNPYLSLFGLPPILLLAGHFVGRRLRYLYGEVGYRRVLERDMRTPSGTEVTCRIGDQEFRIEKSKIPETQDGRLYTLSTEGQLSVGEVRDYLCFISECFYWWGWEKHRLVPKGENQILLVRRPQARW